MCPVFGKITQPTHRHVLLASRTRTSCFLGLSIWVYIHLDVVVKKRNISHVIVKKRSVLYDDYLRFLGPAVHHLPTWCLPILSFIKLFTPLRVSEASVSNNSSSRVEFQRSTFYNYGSEANNPYGLCNPHIRPRIQRVLHSSSGTTPAGRRRCARPRRVPLAVNPTPSHSHSISLRVASNSQVLSYPSKHTRIPHAGI